MELQVDLFCGEATVSTSLPVTSLGVFSSELRFELMLPEPNHGTA